MDNERIEVIQGDWLYNAGIVGFINILKLAGDEIHYDKNSFSFSKSALEGFEEKFFNYLIKTYKKTLSWYKIVNFKTFIDKYLLDDLEGFDRDKLDVLNNFIGTKGKSGTIKYYLNSNSYIKAYQLIENSQELIVLEKELNIVKLDKNEGIGLKKKEILNELRRLKKIIELLEEEKFKKYIAGKNVIYNIVRQGWDGVSFLNPQTKVKNIYNDYKKSFVNDAIIYFEEKDLKKKYSCFTCNREINTLNNSLSFLNEIGFDVARKSSHVWNYVNDVGICPLCKLIYSCIPCGITYVLNNGVFINKNHSIENLVDVNQHMKHEILDMNEHKFGSTYKAMIKALTTSMNKNVKYELSDIQVVRYEDVGSGNKYRFSIFSKRALEVISDSAYELESIMGASFKEVNQFYRLYDEVAKKLINGDQMHIFINKLLLLKLQGKKDLYFRISHIKGIIKINQRFIKGESTMKDIRDNLKKYNSSGYYLKKAYIDKKAENKLNGISYKLLNALKTNNIDNFMDTILNCYLYVNKQVPSFLIKCIQDEETFKSIGYSFVAGLIDGEKYKKENGGN